MIDLSDNNKPLRAILAGLQLSSAKQANEEHFERSMQELHELAKACNAEAAAADLLPRESVVRESDVTVHGEREQVRISARTGAGVESLLKLLDARVKSG